ncbi:MAG: carboxylate--amine ligase [Clostridiales bacterium]|nr:carboxylate--amine ligase [Clostridiales bacterium]
MSEKTITPVLLGAELNAYSVARAFNEKFNSVSYAFGKVALGFTSNSSIIKVRIVDDLADESRTIPMLIDFARKHQNEELYLLGCTDEFAEMIINHRDELGQYYFTPYITSDLAKQLISKEAFYTMCDKYGIDYPKTYIFRSDSDYSVLDSGLPFDYPIIIKPSKSASYWIHPFEGMKKVYSADNSEEAKRIVKQIFDAGYDDSLIIQDTIPGDDSKMYVLTNYSDTDGKVRMMNLGHVLLQEHTPKGMGNHTAVITEYHEEIVSKLRDFLNEIKYVGFSNFDIKFDERDKKFKVFEINLRQGRSNYYVTSSGNNIAECLYNNRHNCYDNDISICKSPFFWITVPKRIVYKYTDDKSMVQRLKKLVKEGKSASSLWYKKDLKNPKRLFFVLVHSYRYFGKYKKYH